MHWRTRMGFHARAAARGRGEIGNCGAVEKPKSGASHTRLLSVKLSSRKVSADFFNTPTVPSFVPSFALVSSISA